VTSDVHAAGDPSGRPGALRHLRRSFVHARDDENRCPPCVVTRGGDRLHDHHDRPHDHVAAGHDHLPESADDHGPGVEDVPYDVCAVLDEYHEHDHHNVRDDDVDDVEFHDDDVDARQRGLISRCGNDIHDVVHDDDIAPPVFDDHHPARLLFHDHDHPSRQYCGIDRDVATLGPG
jgi:hypothetical protein